MDGTLFSLLFFCFAQVAAGLAPLVWPQHKWLAGVIFRLSAFGMVVCLVWYPYSNWDWILEQVDMAGKRNVGMILAAVSLVGFVIGMSLIASDDGSNRDPNPKSATPIPPLTLRSLFDSDFEGKEKPLARTYHDLTFHYPDDKNYTIAVKALWDFYGNSWFGAFYLPRSVPTEISYQCASGLAQECFQLLNKLRNVRKINMKDPGGSSPMSIHDLKFSGRIYIYHETDFSVNEQATLTNLYDLRGFQLQLRGPTYLMSRKLKNVTGKTA